MRHNFYKLEEKEIEWNNTYQTISSIYILHFTPPPTLSFICITFYILFYLVLSSTKVSRKGVMKMETKSTTLPINIFSKVPLLFEE